jgi:hypothetical protein
MFPSPPAGAGTSRPVVKLGQPLPDLAGLCRTEWPQTRMVRIGSPMDSPSMGIPWALGADRTSIWPPFFPACIGATAPASFGVGTRTRTRGPVWPSILPPSPWSKQHHSGPLELGQGARSHGVTDALDRMGLVRIHVGAGFDQAGGRVCRARASSPAPPFSWNLCLYLWPMARRMGQQVWVRRIWCGALSLLSLGPAFAQSALVTWAEEEFALRFPGSDLEARDSVRALLEAWERRPAYINSWPRDGLEDIPFLSAAGAFQLGRYIADQGELIDPLEWRAIPLDSMERRGLQTFFQVGYPDRQTTAHPPSWQVGLARNASGWGPYVYGPGFRWTEWPSLSVLPWLIHRSPGTQPFMRGRTAQSFLAWSPQRGGWGRWALNSHLHVGGGWMDDRWLLSALVQYPRWQWQTLIDGGDRWATSCSLRWPSGMTAQWTVRSAQWGLSTSWLPQAISPGWSWRVPYARGWLEVGHRGARQWMRWNDRSASLGLDRWNHQWRVDASLFLTPRIEAWVFIACSPQSPHALGWRFMASESGPPIRWTVGWMGAGDSWAYGTSSLRMTTPGPYMEGQWRPQWTWHGRSHQGVILVKIRPSGILWTGRYAFQSAQK